MPALYQVQAFSLNRSTNSGESDIICGFSINSQHADIFYNGVCLVFAVQPFGVHKAGTRLA